MRKIEIVRTNKFLYELISSYEPISSYEFIHDFFPVKKGRILHNFFNNTEQIFINQKQSINKAQL